MDKLERRIKRWVVHNRKNNFDVFCKAIICLAIIVIIAAIDIIINHRFEPSKFIDIKIVSAVALFFIIDLVVDTLRSKHEDEWKLSTDVTVIKKRYCREHLLTYEGNTYPALVIAERRASDRPFELEINCDNKDNKYHLPQQIKQMSDYLMQAHRRSDYYNSQTIRIDDMFVDNNVVDIKYSRTTYFDSLLTNRCLDYPIKSRLSLREIYEPGPFLSPLSESKLSNHWGFDGIIQIENNKVIFINRMDDTVVSKNLYGPGISASYKVKYGVNDDFTITPERIGTAIKCELFDELGWTEDMLGDVQLEQTIFVFYRNVVEGGKPQFMFHYKNENITEQEVKRLYREHANKKTKKDKEVDGDKLLLFTIDELREAVGNNKHISEHAAKLRNHLNSIIAAEIAMFLRYCDA